MSNNSQQKPPKGILKTSNSMDSSEGAPSTSKRSKEQRFDEKNLLETYHPANKDYGKMKIDEPPTPYSELADGSSGPHDELDANILAAKLAAAKNKSPKCLHDSDSSDEEEETEEERAKRREFEKKRKIHYNEYQSLKLGRKLMEEESDEDEKSP